MNSEQARRLVNVLWYKGIAIPVRPGPRMMRALLRFRAHVRQR